jgi:FMN phosphatase YigB (HAD superfamily)
VRLQTIEVVLFDVGGVLIEVRGVGQLRSWVGEGISAEAIWARWLRSPAVRRFETGRSDAAEFAGELIEEWELPIEPETLLTEFPTWIAGPLPGAVELVSRVSPHIRRATLSNCNSLHWPRITGDLGLAGCIETHFASHLTGKIKPDPEAFEHAVEHFDCSPAAILFLDDNQLNVDAAKAVGLDAHRVLGLQTAGTLLEAYGVLEP